MTRALAIALWLALFASPALAAIGTPTAISAVTVNGTASGSPSSTTVDAPIGSLIVIVGFTANVGATITGITLSSGDACLQAVQIASGSTETPSIWYCNNTAHDLPSGGTITATTSAGTYGLGAFKISGANGGLDQTANKSNAGATSLSQAIGPFCGSSAVILTVTVMNNTLTAWTEGSAFTKLSGGTGTAYSVAYDIVSASTAVTYAPSWAPSAGYVAVLSDFAATGTCVVAGGSSSLMTMGVGAWNTREPLGGANDNEGSPAARFRGWR